MGSLSSLPAIQTFLPPPFLRRIPFRHDQRHRPLCALSQPKQQSIAKSSKLRTPYDLVHFRRSRFAAHLNELRRRGLLPPEAVLDSPTRLDKALRAAGQAHERRVIEHVKYLTATAEVCEIPFGHPDRYQLTEAAIRQGKPLIQGAAFKDDLFAGYADLLIHASVDPFSTGFGYAVCEIKLASLQKADFILQLSAYATMLDRLQARLGLPTSTYSYLWLGSPESPPSRLEFRTLSHFFRRVSEDYRVFLGSFTPSPIPEPDGPLDKLSPWKTYASQILESSDSLRLIAGIRRSQVREIEEAMGLKTMAEYAEVDDSTVENLIRSRKLSHAHGRLHTQARLQFASRTGGEIQFEKVENSPKGMPVATERDLFFDMEGFPLHEDGLEYLFGVSSTASFHHWWSHTRSEEEASFVQLMVLFKDLLDSDDEDDQPHVFHYGHYEVTALQRVALRVKTVQGIEAAQTFERLLERDIFFDVYDFVRTSMIVGAPSYSIKQVEKLVGISREGDELADAESSVGMYYEWRSSFAQEAGREPNLSNESTQSHPILDGILLYNRQDCESLKDVVAWLQNRFQPLRKVQLVERTSESPDTSEEDEAVGDLIPGACGRSREQKIADSIVIARSTELGILLHHVPTSGLKSFAKQGLSNLLQFYVRESLPTRHAFRRKIETASQSLHEDLFQDDKCLVAVKLAGESSQGSPGKERKLYNYQFDDRQPVSLREGESVAFVIPSIHSNQEVPSNGAINTFMTVKEVNRSAKTGQIVLAGSRKDSFSPPAFGTLISAEDLKVCDAPLRGSILRKSEKIYADEHEPSVSLGLAFLNREPLPSRNENTAWMAPHRSGSSMWEELSEFLAAQERPNVFVIQGPPGSGKTFLSARLIHSLVETHNKTVAVSSNSHDAIDKLLCGAVDAGLCKDKVYKVGRKPAERDKVSYKTNARELNITPAYDEVPENPTSVTESSSGKKVNRKARNHRASLVGATCYQLAQEHCDGKFDFLFIDEASQVNMANFLSMSGCAKYAVLVGDQQQLEMPIKGSHPDQVSISCLSYAVGNGVSIVRPSRGVFLDESYRMNPTLCSFISESFYDKALHSAKGCSENTIILPDSPNKLVNTGHGIQFVPCDSFMSQVLQESIGVHGKWNRPAEVLVLSRIVEELLGLQYATRKVPLSAGKRLDVEDILVVAPYNAQVRALQAALPDGVRVGTVDKFQGQEAPVVLVSTCAGDMDNSQFSADGEYEDSCLVEESFSGMSQSSTTQRRGLRFALRKNRLNVALSRAECLAIVTGQSKACSRMILDSYEDIETAALYESLQLFGSR